MAKKTININLTGEAIFKVFDVAERTVKSMAHITGYTLLFLLSAGAIGFLVRKPIKKKPASLDLIDSLKKAESNLKSKIDEAASKAEVKVSPKATKKSSAKEADGPSDPIKPSDSEDLHFLD